MCGERAAGYRPVRLRDTETLDGQLAAAGVYYFDRVAPANLELARKARAAGALVVFEPSGVKDPRLFLECLRATHVFKYSHERFDEHEGLVSEALVPIVVQTRGADGLRVSVRTTEGRVITEDLPAIPAPRLHDAAGSGDWCTAGLIHGLMEQDVAIHRLGDAAEGVVAVLRHAQALAALNCAFEGARGVMYVMPKKKLLQRATAIAEGRDVEVPAGVEDGAMGDAQRGGLTCVVCSRAVAPSHASSAAIG